MNRDRRIDGVETSGLRAFRDRLTGYLECRGVGRGRGVADGQRNVVNDIFSQTIDVHVIVV